MSPEYVISLTSQAILDALIIAAPMLSVGLVVGLAISIFQAVTQINEISLSFIPKVLAMMLTLMALAPWMLNKLMMLTIHLFEQIPTVAP